MKILNYCINNVIVRNLFFLLLIFLFQVGEFWTYMERSGQTVSEFLTMQFSDSIVIMTIILINHLVLIRFFFDRKRYLLYATLLLMAILAAAYLTGISRGWVKVNTLSFYYTYFVAAGMAAFFLHKNVKISRDASEQKELQKEMELRYLKGQVNPHFLFNSLNTIYSLSRQQSKNTPDIVMQLSDLMRYQLESAKLEKVPLTMETEFIANYLLLEEQRLSGRCTIEFSIDGELSGLSIAPMLLIPLVENAIKHGAQNTLDKSNVDVKVIARGPELTFHVSNSKVSEENLSKQHTGIGLTNLKRRLWLLYPNNHSLQLIDGKLVYEAALIINLG